MPYITQGERDKSWEDFIEEGYIPNAGTLNYLITTLCDEYLSGDRAEEFSYSQINTVVGVLECAKMEMYRRLAVPYEDHKRNRNGEVYTMPRY
jgi:hypothetical protein